MQDFLLANGLMPQYILYYPPGNDSCGIKPDKRWIAFYLSSVIIRVDAREDCNVHCSPLINIEAYGSHLVFDKGKVVEDGGAINFY